MKLKNNNKQVYNRIELLPMIDRSEDNSNNVEEDHHFLILFKREEELSIGTSCNLREAMGRRIKNE
jgi:hypothetical protein